MKTNNNVLFYRIMVGAKSTEDVKYIKAPFIYNEHRWRKNCIFNDNFMLTWNKDDTVALSVPQSNLPSLNDN